MHKQIALVSYSLFLVLILLHGQKTNGVHLDPRVGKYVKLLVAEFMEKPTSTRFNHVVLPPRNGLTLADYLCPKVFIWCPVAHYNVEIKCPLHNCPLKPGMFTDEVQKKSPRNPRLVYDLRGNVILIQRMYLCQHKGASHRYLSASETILRSLPPVYSQNCFPIQMLYRTACTKELIDLVETQILQGVSFLKTCEVLATLNFKEFCERVERYALFATSSAVANRELYEQFYSDPMSSFPSNDMLMYIFLEDFQKKEPYYETDMTKRAFDSTTISCDHTFKISKYIGARRESDNKYVKQFENLFIVLNERHEVIGWRLTRTTSFEEIRSLLVGLKEKIRTELKRVVVDDCCKVRALYQSVFPGVEVKLDIFHAVQRVTKVIPKGSEFSKKFSKDLGMIFRQNGDCGEFREMATPSQAVILENLENFSKRWSAFLSLEEMNRARLEIDHLRAHIRKDCLSDLEPGEGTESNERLHNTLNKSLLCGATTVGPELAIAIISLIFYAINCKRDGRKHEQNSKIVPLVPLFKLGASTIAEKSAHINSESSQQVSLDNVWKRNMVEKQSATADKVLDEIAVIEHIEDMCNETVYNLLLRNMATMHTILDKVNSECNDRSFNAYDIPIMQLSSLQQVLTNSSDNENNSRQMHENSLQRNLACFNMVKDPVIGDGDCAFTAIVSQMRKTTEWTDKRSLLRERLTYLGLGDNADADVLKLRQLFVDNVQSNDHYQMLSGIPSLDLNAETERFREPGTFSGDIGDLVVKVCSDFLQVPIIVVTSINGSPYVPFIPDEAVITKPIYIAFNAYGPGHYDGTRADESYASKVCQHL